VVWTETDFHTGTDASEHYSRALSELAADESRNALIAGKVARGTGTALILSDRKAHCETLAAMLEDRGIKAEVLTGSSKDRDRIIDDMQQGRCKHLVATGSLIGEGFDLPAISSLYLATPVKYHGRLIQYVGRVLRPSPGKDQAMIYDFADNRMGVFAASARSRAETYAQQGIE
jgi:superfamily II DNA or RNA helicase